MVAKSLLVHTVIFTLFLTLCSGKNSLADGVDLGEPRFMVYLVKLAKSTEPSKDWLCGGAIVSRSHILTTAACISNIDSLYAVAGYSVYVEPNRLDEDECTANWKKKVVKVFIPKSFFTNNDGWNNYDIGVAMTQTPFDFSEDSYKRDCSYVPTYIKISYDLSLEEVNSDVTVFGWGHRERLRMPHELQTDEHLRESPLVIINKEDCRKKIDADETGLARQREVIDATKIICALGKVREKVKVTTMENPTADVEDSMLFRRNDNTQNLSEPTNKSASEFKLKQIYPAILRSRDNCQNDHGGPLVAWVNDKPIIIGVSSTNLYYKKYNCLSPSLFTSTAKTEWFIRCSIKGDAESKKECEKLENTKEIKEYDLSWKSVDKDPKPPSTFQQQPNLPIIQQVPVYITSGQNSPFVQNNPFTNMNTQNQYPIIYQQLFNSDNQGGGKVFNSGFNQNDADINRQITQNFQNQRVTTPEMMNNDDEESMEYQYKAPYDNKPQHMPGMSLQIIVNQNGIMMTTKGYRNGKMNVRPFKKIRQKPRQPLRVINFLRQPGNVSEIANKNSSNEFKQGAVTKPIDAPKVSSNYETRIVTSQKPFLNDIEERLTSQSTNHTTSKPSKVTFSSVTQQNIKEYTMQSNKPNSTTTTLKRSSNHQTEIVTSHKPLLNGTKEQLVGQSKDHITSKGLKVTSEHVTSVTQQNVKEYTVQITQQNTITTEVTSTLSFKNHTVSASNHSLTINHH